MELDKVCDLDSGSEDGLVEDEYVFKSLWCPWSVRMNLSISKNNCNEILASFVN